MWIWTLSSRVPIYIFGIYGHHSLLMCIWFPWASPALILNLLRPCHCIHRSQGFGIRFLGSSTSFWADTYLCRSCPTVLARNNQGWGWGRSSNNHQSAGPCARRTCRSTPVPIFGIPKVPVQVVGTGPRPSNEVQCVLLDPRIYRFSDIQYKSVIAPSDKARNRLKGEF